MNIGKDENSYYGDLIRTITLDGSLLGNPDEYNKAVINQLTGQDYSYQPSLDEQKLLYGFDYSKERIEQLMRHFSSAFASNDAVIVRIDCDSRTDSRTVYFLGLRKNMPESEKIRNAVSKNMLLDESPLESTLPPDANNMRDDDSDKKDIDIDDM